MIPRSHRHGFIDSIELHRNAKGYALYELDRGTVARLADKNGIVPLIGNAGTVALVNCNLIHGSANNISPWPRAILYLIYNACDNACRNYFFNFLDNNVFFTPLEAIEYPSLG